MDQYSVTPSFPTGLLLTFLAIGLAVTVFYIACYWKIFTKAGKPGWAVLVPIYNVIVMLEIAGKPAWWFLLLLIPFVNFIIGIIVIIEFAKNFGRSVGFALGMIFLGIIFIPILAFGDAEYIGG
jgi:hypothetical protein